MVFSRDGRVVRLVEISEVDFVGEVMKSLYGRTWSPQTRIIKVPDAPGVTLRDG
ncbi:hypothetical protein [Actinomadura sediminis]|uniref:Uncharacterized protein n=1 Tax=Actinomadura sediminis TaxID=1038904 RepID=A0ABW3EK15_9ACTN